jgi:hypothetical protein
MAVREVGGESGSAPWVVRIHYFTGQPQKTRYPIYGVGEQGPGGSELTDSAVDARGGLAAESVKC